MILLASILLASEPQTKGSITKPLFSAEEVAGLSQLARRDCGYSTPQTVISLGVAKRKKALACLVRVTLKQSSSMLPKVIEPGATLVSASEFEGLLVFVLQFASNHPRALVPKDQPSDYDQMLSNRTCQDQWLGGLIDAGIVDGAQAGTMIVYQMQNEKRETLAANAVGHCFTRN